MLNLSAYRLADLQTARALLTQAATAGLTLDELRHQLSAHCASVIADRPAGQPTQPARPTRRCPHCDAPMVPVINPEGLQIMGCRQCRYSTIEVRA